ncbi:unnamed protein product [Pylaiella littoralis]
MRGPSVFLALLALGIAEAQTCSGILRGTACCVAECGECGGTGCSDRGGGLTGDDCCTSKILAAGVSCGSPPCVTSGGSSGPSPTPATTDFTCDGVQSGDYCCTDGCGTCGGTNCSSRGSGLTKDDCCQSAILASGNLCSVTGAAPCFIDGGSSGPSPTPATTDFSCDGPVKGDYCCSDGCVTCGGSGCNNRGSGTTGEDCCTSKILASGRVCSETGASPCLIDDRVACGDSVISAVTPKKNCNAGDSSGPSPTPTPPTPTPPAASTCTGTVADISTSSTWSYFQGGGCATLTDMYNTQSGSGPLYVLDSSDSVVSGGGGSASPTGRWLLTSGLQVLDDVTLYVHGTSSGGDADVLRIQSTDDDFWEIRAWGGSLSFQDTTVTSWDTETGQERTAYSGGRSFINCVTQFDDSSIWSCDGRSNKERGECRMDIIDSTMGNLGWPDAESYGLTWKVRGFCKDLSNPELFEDHNVYGDIKGSEIYGMYYGMYSYGHQGGVWTNNIMRDNVLYGFDPHDDSDDLTIASNSVYGNGNHGIIASKRCNNVKIYDNEVFNGDKVGIFLHRSSDNAEVYNNYIHDNGDAGIALMESFGAEIYDNKIENCKYGIRFSLGSANNDIHDNTFDSSSSYAFYTYQGSDSPDVSGNDGRPKNNLFNMNTVTDTDVGTLIKNADDNSFTNNVFTGVKTFEFSDSTDTTWTGNSIGSACRDGSADFASGSIPSC